MKLFWSFDNPWEFGIENRFNSGNPYKVYMIGPIRIKRYWELLNHQKENRR
jgi:hypothetical protein